MIRLTSGIKTTVLMIALLWVELYGQGSLGVQATRGWLTVDTIMIDRWAGTSPSNVFWSEDGKKVYFNWRRKGDEGDSLYVVDVTGEPRRVKRQEREKLPSRGGDYSRNWRRKVYAREGDLFLLEVDRMNELQLTRTAATETNPRFLLDEETIVFEREGNLYVRHLKTGLESQVTNFLQGAGPSKDKKTDLQSYLEQEALSLSDVLRKRKDEREKRKEGQKESAGGKPAPYYFGQKNLFALQLSPDGRYVTFVASQRAREAKSTIVPSYVTESGFTEDINARTKVGEPLSTFEFHIYDVRLDSVFKVKPDGIPGVVSATTQTDTGKSKPKPRELTYNGPYWSDDGAKAFVQVFSQDNKDRWLVLLDPEHHSFGTTLERQHDDAWIGGPGIGFFGGNAVGWMPDSKRIYFQSEADGWSHLYVIGIDGEGKRQLTKGQFEVYGPGISRDKRRWYFSSNEQHFGERHLYSMPLEGGSRLRITSMEGRNDCFLSPDEKKIALLFSSSNTLPELFTMENKMGARVAVRTDSRSEAFRSYAWRLPEVLRFSARDGAEIPARLYKPERPNGAAVIFVHGAGYLQNAHKWWSSYFHEYMFHNMLVDRGYTVLDMDYRASAGHGRDWRTAIYRFMGGKDLDDQVDGARWLVSRHGIDSTRIGIYGGSYGGFITLMAMFTEPGIFAAGAALRPVTDWAHYNHGYTSAILNIPQEDSIAYRRSSPIYHAEGLKGALLICHGMVDVNVHFQDAVRLAQRLIELKKENWELAVYPVENHGFVEETSWMDEYKRILKLFETHLAKEE